MSIYVELSPTREDPVLAQDNDRNNDFRDGRDLAVYRCPAGAHSRRVNPRNGSGKTVNPHRVKRRSMTYSEVLPSSSTEDDGKDRGVVVMALNAAISRQFKFIQTQWLNDENIIGPGTDKDLTLCNCDGSDKMTIQVSQPRFLAHAPRFVTVRGGAYLFLPGVNALRFLADDA